MKIARFVFLLLFSYNLSSQIGFEQHVIIETSGGTNSIFTEDLDGDGDMDIVTSDHWRDRISWFENLDGQGNFGLEKHITYLVQNPRSVHSADIDNDGDMDILSASVSDDKIAWYENMDGQGTFGSQQIISIEANGAYFVYSSDLDNDGDIDVLSASRFDGKVVWYENLDGQGNFSSEKVITVDAVNVLSIFSTDLDND